MSSFALQCLVCGAGLKGNADAEAHAAATGHQNFARRGTEFFPRTRHCTHSTRLIDYPFLDTLHQSKSVSARH